MFSYGDEKHEFDDCLPLVYKDVTGQEFPEPEADDHLLRAEDWELLRQVCGEDEEFLELQASLLDIQREFRGMSRRAGIYEALEDRLRAGQFACAASRAQGPRAMIFRHHLRDGTAHAVQKAAAANELVSHAL